MKILPNTNFDAGIALVWRTPLIVCHTMIDHGRFR